MMKYTLPLILLAVAASTPGGAAPASPHHAHARMISSPVSRKATVTPSACAMITKADVDAAFAPRVFKDGAKGVGDFAGTARLASVSSCSFTSRGASIRDLLTVGLLVRRAPNDQTGVSLATAKDGAVKLKLTPVDVAGMGDAAYWVNIGSEKRPNLQLNVFKGKRLWIIYSVSGAGLDVVQAIASLTNVAQETLPRI